MVLSLSAMQRTMSWQARTAIAVAAGVALTLAAAVPGAHAGFHVCGDPTNDGVVSAVDALYVLQVDAGLVDLPAPAFSSTDVNNDGAVNARDALFILQYDAGLVPDLDCVS